MPKCTTKQVNVNYRTASEGFINELNHREAQRPASEGLRHKLYQRTAKTCFKEPHGWAAPGNQYCSKGHTNELHSQNVVFQRASCMSCAWEIQCTISESLTNEQRAKVQCAICKVLRSKYCFRMPQRWAAPMRSTRINYTRQPKHTAREHVWDIPQAGHLQ